VDIWQYRGSKGSLQKDDVDFGSSITDARFSAVDAILTRRVGVAVLKLKLSKGVQLTCLLVEVKHACLEEVVGGFPDG
jgi:hypothetical protein